MLWLVALGAHLLPASELKAGAYYHCFTYGPNQSYILNYWTYPQGNYLGFVAYTDRGAVPGQPWYHTYDVTIPNLNSGSDYLFQKQVNVGGLWYNDGAAWIDHIP